MEERFIIVKASNRKKLADKYGVSQGTLTNALKFQRFSVTARKLRSDAVNVYDGIPFM